MATLFFRTFTIYVLVFAVVRLMGKRQLSDMQPFDLVVTLLIADAASAPISDTGTPLLCGVLPVLGLFIIHRLVSFIALKSERARRLVCGSPVIVIAGGAVCEDALRAACFTVTDLMEQLRLKDVFSISEVSFGILETNGSLSVLKKDGGECAGPSVLLVCDGRPRREAIASLGLDEGRLKAALGDMGISAYSELLYACTDGSGSIFAQRKRRRGGSSPLPLRGSINEGG